VRDPGRLAQLGEHQLDKLGVTGSSPVPPTRERPAQAGFDDFVHDYVTVGGQKLSKSRATRSDPASLAGR
jgi:hypothetical protein